MALPDPERHLSKRHCVIEERGGDYFLIDLSTNGTFVNYGAERVGEDPMLLNDGDVVTLGPFEFKVAVDGAAAASRRSLRRSAAAAGGR